MCIRDSLLVDRDHIAARIITAEQLVVAVFERSLRGERAICLLYTSDAADERSSVDLGGRRIITKKKKYMYYDGLRRHSA